MTDSLLIDAAIAEADSALALLRLPAPADPVARRKQMAQAAKSFNRASRMLTEWEDELAMA